ncbi:hypothetical protein P3T37_007426 [Kitasatospora sp. MAA4]|uniref:hypothetical protein n=1 Tax=Kitasatospora sp. MAA4 TaxID=3035093 RepID=UPI002476EDC5|nr:hypothetical protein [Kitasatospora sp. MAA4]MDH6137983.1 hypothetical protein [Kitasatospora sp. MAA4]
MDMRQLTGTLIVAPAALGLLARLMRHPRGALTELTSALRDLITLRMVLRDTNHEQRAALLRAH